MTRTDNPLLHNVQQNRYQEQKRRSGEKLLAKIGDCRSLQRLLGKYGKVLSWYAALFHLNRYFTWLRVNKGVTLNPDELVVDNLKCVYDSKPVDVATKRRHTDWLDEFVNQYLVGKEIADQSRATTASFVKLFYERNDSPLFGSFSVSLQSVRPSPPALEANDVRAVLKALPLAQRIPLLLMWQGGVEINRVLSLTWSDIAGIDNGEYPLKLQFYGRKRHRRQYFTFLGRDSIDGLKAWREKWTELQRRKPEPTDLVFMGKGGPMSVGNLNGLMRRSAMAQHRQGLVKNGYPGSYHSHYLRHSFKSEAEHAGVKSAFVEFFMGHQRGIEQTYDNRDELHPEDYEAAYRRLEPHVSLEFTKALLTEKFEEERKSWIIEIASLRQEVARLAGSSPQAGPGASAT